MAKLAKMSYAASMRVVNIGELKNQLSGFLKLVKNGEEIVVKDRSEPVARILPFRHGLGWEHEAELVAAGALKMPEESFDWEEFFRDSADQEVSQEVGQVELRIAVQAAIDGRGDR